MKKMQGVVASLLLAAMVFSFVGCGSVKEIASKDFKSVVKDVLDCDKEDLYENESKDYNSIYYSGDDSDKYYVSFTEYDDEEEAKYVFERTQMRLQFYKSHDGIEGKFKSAKNYVVMDAEVTSSYDGDSDDRYGGTYFTGTTIITIYTYTGKDKDKDVIDDLLKELGLPKPSRA